MWDRTGSPTAAFFVSLWCLCVSNIFIFQDVVLMFDLRVNAVQIVSSFFEFYPIIVPVPVQCVRQKKT